MNRYLIAALYVMAGCVVTVPLKVQGNPEPLRGERCRLIITAAVKTVSEYTGDREVVQAMPDLVSEYNRLPEPFFHETVFSAGYRDSECITATEYTSHKIRAPERD